MLTCYGHTVRLPQTDLVYVAFRLALQETLSDLEIQFDLDEDPVGYLIEVPFLQQVPAQVQVDLLADTWARQRSPDFIEASLLDAAVVFACCVTAGRVIDDMPEVAAASIQDGPRRVDLRIFRRASYRLEEMFEQFWDDEDFLLIDEFQDLPPDRARHLKELLRLPDEALEPLYDALQRWRVLPGIEARLEGLMTEGEIDTVSAILEKAISQSEPEDIDSSLMTGIEDQYHNLLVGPCDRATAKAEAESRLVDEIEACGDAFDCTYDEWATHLRDAISEAASRTVDPPSDAIFAEHGNLVELAQEAMSVGLDDGTRIDSYGDGWVIVDSFQSYLGSPEEAYWVMDPDDGDMPAAVFPTPEAAIHGWLRYRQVTEARTERRAEALKRLGKPAD